MLMTGAQPECSEHCIVPPPGVIACGQQVWPLAMRDSDIDLHSVQVVPATSNVQSLGDLRGKTIDFGAIDSPQATLIPLDHLRHKGGLVAGHDYQARRFDLLGGKHGDHIGGVRDAASALVLGEIDATWMIAGNYRAFANEGTLPARATRIVATTDAYDHCNMTVSPGVSQEDARRFDDLLLTMDWNDAQVRPLLELEGLRVSRPGRRSAEYRPIPVLRDGSFCSDTGRHVLGGRA
jgi:phosphonate transport system substrate-binding protein